MLLNLGKVVVGHTSSWNHTSGTHLRHCQAEWTVFPFGESVVNDLEDTVAWLRRHITIYHTGEVITLRAIKLTAIQPESIEAEMEIVWANVATICFFGSLPSVPICSIVVGLLEPGSVDQVGSDDVINVCDTPHICLFINWKSPRS